MIKHNTVISHPKPKYYRKNSKHKSLKKLYTKRNNCLLGLSDDRERNKMQEKDKKVNQAYEKDIWFGQDGNRMFHDEDNIIHDILVGDIDEESARSRIDAMKEFANTVDGKIKLLADCNKCGKPSSKARKIVKEVTENYDKLGKHAIVGVNPIARIIGSFILRATKKKDIRFFKTKEKALAWLRE